MRLVCGVGSLQGALDEVELRIQTAETASSNLNAAKDKIGSFIDLTKTVDLTVSGLVNRNKHEFYNLNEWSRPPQKEEEKEWYEKLYDWACGVGDSIAETAWKAWNGIKSFCSSVKEELDELFAGFQEWWKDHTTITPTEVKDEVYNPKRYVDDEDYRNDFYGGRQHGPMLEVNQENTEAYLRLIKANTDRDLTDAELYQYAKDINSHGCAYTAIVNTIFEYYVNQPDGEEKFIKKFGFPLRDSDGNLNYGCVLIDIYSKENGFNIAGSSLTPKDEKRVLKNYMADSGADGASSVEVDMKLDAHVTVNNVDNYIRDGKQIIVSGNNLILYSDADKSVLLQNCGGAGHAMTVTGVTENGMLIVSTWGQKAYLDPKDAGMKNTENYDSSRGDKITMTYRVVEYK